MVGRKVWVGVKVIVLVGTGVAVSDGLGVSVTEGVIVCVTLGVGPANCVATSNDRETPEQPARIMKRTRI